TIEILFSKRIFLDLEDAHEESKAMTKPPAMKSGMEKDVDEVGKISRFVSNWQKPECGKGTGVDR
ncbi:hypothetical protein J1N35_034602, partial [Gossypium stocksii]